MNILLVQQILFISAIAGLFFLPGYLTLRLFSGRTHGLSRLEKFFLAPAFGMILIDILLIVLGKFGVPINAPAILAGVTLFCAISFVLSRYFSCPAQHDKPTDLFSFTRRQGMLFLILLVLTVLARVWYLSNTIFPTATDLGHHGYWIQQVAATHALPTYTERDIVQEGDNVSIGNPRVMPDFIIGEHLPLAAIHIVTGLPLVSPYPSLFLLFINILSVLALFALAVRFFSGHPRRIEIGLAVLLLAGPLFAISASQAKYASGGVIGNTFGNYFIPVAFYFLFRAFRERSALFLALAVTIAWGLAYTHHLSALVFAFSAVFAVAMFILLRFRSLKADVSRWRRVVVSYPVLIVAIFIALMLLAYMPTYLNADTIGSAVGEPTKATRTGLSISQLAEAAGEARFALGLAGLVALLFLSKSLNPYAVAISSGWLVALVALSLHPDLLNVNIISSRIANYITYPLAVTGGFALAELIGRVRSAAVPTRLVFFGAALVILFVVANGYRDNTASLKPESNAAEAVQTYSAAGYLASRIGPEAGVVKDHNYIVADTWMKIWFVRDYNFPFSRGFFKRYEDPTNPREQCTLAMISEPSSPQASACFAGTGVNYIVVNPAYDSAQFEKNPAFSKPFISDGVAVYFRHFAD